MWMLASSPRLFRQCGLALALVALGCVLFTLPPLHIGIWRRMEPMTIGVYATSCLAALWLVVGALRGWLVAVRPTQLALVLLVWVGWQLSVWALNGFSWRSWFGPIDNADGTALWLCALALFWMFGALWREAALKQVLVYGALGGTLLAALMHVLPLEAVEEGGPSWLAPAKWPDYLAFSAGYLWIVALLWRNPIEHPRWFIGMVAFTFGVLFVSQNLSGTVLMGAAMLCSVLAYGLAQRGWAQRFFAVNRAWRALLLLGCVLPAAYIPLSAYIPVLNNTVERTSIEGDLFDSESSTGSRIVHNQLGLATLEYDPQRLWQPPGWGRFTDDMFRYAMTLDGASAFIGEARNSQTKWLVFGNAFHTHTQPLEALISQGLVGMLLWYALLLAAVLATARASFWVVAPMVAALGALGHLWFELPHSLPLHALMLAAVAASAPMVPLMRRSAVLPALVLCVALLVTTALQWQTSQRSQRLMDSLLQVPAATFDAQELLIDARRGGERFYETSKMMTEYLARRQQQNALSSNDRAWLSLYLRAGDAAIAENASPRLVAMQLFLLNNLYFALPDPGLAPLREAMRPAYRRAVVRLAQLAPLREDFAAVYLHEVARIDPETASAFDALLEELLAIHPQHRSALWLLGSRLLASPDEAARARGRTLQQQALALGVERVYPLTKQEMQAALGDKEP
jgi:hypothetical protein